MDGPKLSAKMPAVQDAQMSPRFPAKMASDAPATGGGSETPDVVEISRDSSQNDPQWDNLNDMHGDRVQASDWKTGPADGYSAADRVETDMGGLPQRAADED